MIEHEYHITSVRKWLASGPTPSGVRQHDLIQFIAYKFGLRTVAVKDIVDIQ